MNWACQYCPYYDEINSNPCNISDLLCPFTILNLDNTFFINKHGNRGEYNIK